MCNRIAESNVFAKHKSRVVDPKLRIALHPSSQSLKAVSVSHLTTVSLFLLGFPQSILTPFPSGRLPFFLIFAKHSHPLPSDRLTFFSLVFEKSFTRLRCRIRGKPIWLFSPISPSPKIQPALRHLEYVVGDEAPVGLRNRVFDVVISRMVVCIIGLALLVEVALLGRLRALAEGVCGH